MERIKSKEKAKIRPPILDYSNYNLFDIVEEYIKLIGNNIYLYPEFSFQIFEALNERYYEIKEEIMDIEIEEDE